MTRRDDASSDQRERQRREEDHRTSRRRRHARRPCGGNTPATPSGLGFSWETTEKGRHRRLSVTLDWNPVITNTAGARTRTRRYILQLQRSNDGGTTRAGKTRKWVIPEPAIRVRSAVITSGTIAEFTMKEGHDFDASDIVTVADVAPGGYNGTWTVLAAGLTNTKWRANIGSSPGASSAGGIAHEDKSRLEVRSVRKHTWYRFRVKAENSEGCLSEWSSWTSWTLASDRVAPPSPLLVKGFTNSTNRLVVDWEPPVVWLPIEGTVSASAGTATVTGAGTFFQTQLGKGDLIKLGAEERTVLSITNDTTLTVTTNWGSTHAAGTVCYAEEPDPDVAFYQVWVGTSATFGIATRYRVDRYTHATNSRTRVADADAGTVFYIWVRSMDASGNRSLWIPATAAGNSSEGATPDGFRIGAGGAGFIVAPFTKPGLLRVNNYRQRWVNSSDKTLEIRRVRLTIGDHVHGSHASGEDGTPLGSPVKVQMKHNSSKIGTLNTSIDAGATSILVDETTTPPGVAFELRIDGELMNVTARSGASNPRTYTVSRNFDGLGAAAHTAGASTIADPEEKKTDFSPVKTKLFTPDASRLNVNASSHKDAKSKEAFAVTLIEPDEYLTVQVEEVGNASNPGTDLSLNVYLTEA